MSFLLQVFSSGATAGTTHSIVFRGNQGESMFAWIASAHSRWSQSNEQITVWDCLAYDKPRKHSQAIKSLQRVSPPTNISKTHSQQTHTKTICLTVSDWLFEESNTLSPRTLWIDMVGCIPLGFGWDGMSGRHRWTIVVIHNQILRM